MSRWYVEKKKKGDFAMSFPYKATTGGVCSDFKTRKAAQKFANEENRKMSQ